MGLVLLIITFIIIVLVALIFRANDRISIKSYIFQINNFANQRVGELQDINDISAEELRNKLIKKYVSEYFKVIPGEVDVENRAVLRDLSSPTAFAQWQNGEAKKIAQMSAQNMFRMVHVQSDGIATLNRPSNYNYNDSKIITPIYYAVRYYMETWPQSNQMGTSPILDQGTIYIEASFEPGIRETINGHKIDLKKRLQSKQSPVSLFKFKVTNIGSKEFK